MPRVRRGFKARRRRNRLLKHAKGYYAARRKQFSTAIENCEDPALVTVLTQLCDLYALHRIHLDRGWFLEQGYLEGNKSKAIRKLVNKLCAEVRLQAVPLVDAFGIPEACLGAPIARPS